MWGKPAERLLQPGNKTCLVPGLRSKQIKMNWCKLSDFGEWGRKNAHRSIRLRKQATKDRISTHILGDNTQWRKGSQISYIPTLCGLDKKRRFWCRITELKKSEETGKNKILNNKVFRNKNSLQHVLQLPGDQKIISESMQSVINFKTGTTKKGFTIHTVLSYEYLHTFLEFTFLGFENVSACTNCVH